MSESPTPSECPVPNQMQFNIPDGSKIILATTESVLTIEFSGSIIRLSSDEELNLQGRAVSTDTDVTYIGKDLNVAGKTIVGKIYGPNEVQLIGDQQPAIADATTPANAVDTVNAVLAGLRAHGLFASQ